MFGVLLIVAMAVMFCRRRWRWFLGFALLILLSGDLYRSVWGGFGVGCAGGPNERRPVSEGHGLERSAL